jgi:hypothetical protein
MVRPIRVAEAKEVVYTEERWQLFRRLRQRARELMAVLAKQRIDTIVHGSIARGDVDPNSDVDVFVPLTVPSYKIELALRDAGFQPIDREIVIATPWQLPKAHIHIDENRLVTFPLIEPKQLELEFYYFGGAVDLEQVEGKIRVPGVDKRLMLIKPTSRGHHESPIIGREAEVAKLIGVSLDIVRERVQILTRRAEVGRTGIFLQRKLAPDENFETVFKQIVKTTPAIKLRLKEKS